MSEFYKEGKGRTTNRDWAHWAARTSSLNAALGPREVDCAGLFAQRSAISWKSEGVKEWG